MNRALLVTSARREEDSVGAPEVFVMKSGLPWKLCLLVVSVLLIAGGLVLAFIWPLLFKYVLDSNLVLTPTAHTYGLWKKFPQEFPIDFYFFNWTNPEDINNATIKPKFTEMGPYRYKETKEKSNITWNSNGTVTFRHLKFWYFRNNTGDGNINDMVTTVNPVALAAAYTARTWNFFIRRGLSLSLSTAVPTIHLSRSVREMLFDGYDDPLLNMAKSIPFLPADSLPPWDKFGWFYTRNGSETYEGVFTMGTGKSTDFGKLYRWNGWTQTPYYEEDCGKINGSAGELFPPRPAKDFIALFSPDMCRTMLLNYVGESVVDGIVGNKYSAEAYMFDNGTLFPENSCFCNGECVPSGLVNVSSCRFGSPAFASLPHFYNADPYYIDSTEGLKPEKNRHEFFIVLEPITGIPLEVRARLQINLLMQPISEIKLYENVPKVFVPMLWFEQRVKIPDSEIFLLKLLLNMPVICITGGILLIFTGFITCSCLIYKICTMKICTKKNNAHLYAEQHIPLKLEHQSDVTKKM